jgi:tetratricopeptide (TPR) repeat protein
MRNLSIRTLVLAVALLLFALPAPAQKSGGGKSSGGSHTTPAPPVPAYNPNYVPRSSEGEFDNKVVFLSEDSHPIVKNDLPQCFRWPMSPVQSATVSATGLEISNEARAQFNEGCSSLQKKKTKEAEQRFNRVVELNPKYAAAWALLGQANKDQGKLKEAAEFCTRAKEADANYLPGYLCLADVAARQNEWKKVAELTNQVIGMHPMRAPSAYYYSTLAYFNLKLWREAEKSAQQALQDSSKVEKLELHWLLAKIYEQKRDRDSEAQQLREYLALNSDGPDASTVRHILKQIEAHTAK